MSGELDRHTPHPIRGFWRQVGGPADSDFGCGGYLDSMLMLNPGQSACTVYRLYRGAIAIVLAGELALDATVAPDGRSGELVLRRDPELSSEFREEPLSLGGKPETVVAPTAGRGPWTLRWHRDGDQLVIGDKRYAAADRASFDRMRKGGADEATPEERAERLPRPREDASQPGRNETSFFGVRGGGKRICFIVDVSGSMAGAKLERLKQELDATIQGLPDATQFLVVFFDDQAHTMQQTWMKGAADKATASQAIQALGTGGGTNPTDAFEFAFKTLSPIPDCIYFMTDGMIPGHVPALVATLNSSKTPTTIHAICFGEPMGAPPLEQLAKDGGGTYLFVAP